MSNYKTYLEWSYQRLAKIDRAGAEHRLVAVVLFHIFLMNLSNCNVGESGIVKETKPRPLVSCFETNGGGT